MKVFLLEPDKEVDGKNQPYINEELLIKDLELNKLFNNMSKRDPFIHKVARKTLLSKVSSIETIEFRQDILKDCLANPEILRELYQISTLAISKRKDFTIVFNFNNPTSTLSESRKVLKLFFGVLSHIKKLLLENKNNFNSSGFNRFINMVIEDLNDDYLLQIKDTLHNLRFDKGILISSDLGAGNVGANYTLLRENDDKEPWIKKVFNNEKSYSYDIAAHSRILYRSDSEALLVLQEKVIFQISKILAESANHLEAFFKNFQFQLGFYIGCMNLYETLMQLGEPISFPKPVGFGKFQLEFSGLYDISLVLTENKKIVSNDFNLDDKSFIVITGANQGGKSTFLRSIGISQLMMQCGMFVPAQSYSANLQRMIFTHFKREEDIKMKHGKLDEELGRMNFIIDHLTPNSLILFNESFTSTNEREGSEIAKQIVNALLGSNTIKMIFVTHLFSFANYYFENRTEKMAFLRAPRESDGSRTFKLIEGEPYRTSFAKDLYYSLFS